MPAKFILLGIVALPLVEIGVFIAVGEAIGIGWTLALVVLSFILGIVLLRRQGYSTLQSAQAQMRAGVAPDREIVHAAMIFIAALLLIIPGFVTDFFGLLLFLSPVRDFLWTRARRHMVVETTMTREGTRNPASTDSGVIDLQDDEFSRRDDNSPWSRDDAGDGPDRLR
ncbi:membrane protein FxsA [Aureimonas fodinaquatilis]|uniref:Membrane protein FxsA n=1 Tax=Aureimonas fodinaquatilis TaxID=2565783 RepID=A0A5B0DQK6_9HYPH|nr:FxsA family protein [Aureimonas fodinaquatilis]KAA0968252.1 membrane protein FxsA [Aureimonas fodinaquatilis]